MVYKKHEEIKKREQLLRRASLLFVICYNCGGKECAIKSCMSASRKVCKKSERSAVSVDSRKKKVKIIDDDGFSKLVNI